MSTHLFVVMLVSWTAGPGTDADISLSVGEGTN